MLNRLMVNAIAAIASFGMIAGLANLSVAKSTPQKQSNPVVTPSDTAANPQFDLPLLLKTSQTFFKGDSYQTLSQMQIKGASEGTDFTFNAQIKTIVKFPNQFRSEIAFIQPGQIARKTAQVVSDGKQVYIYRPDLKQYSVSTYADFNKSDDSFLMGLSSSFFLEFGDDISKMISSGMLTEQIIMNEFGADINQAIKGENRKIDGKDLYVYSYNDTKQGYSLNAFVNPLLANLEQMQIVGKDGGMDISITEKILERSSATNLTPQSFKFAPPKGVKKVKSLSISPF